MEFVPETTAQQLVALLGKCAGDPAGVGGAGDRLPMPKSRGQSGARGRGGDFEVGDEQDEVKLR